MGNAPLRSYIYLAANVDKMFLNVLYFQMVNRDIKNGGYDNI